MTGLIGGLLVVSLLYSPGKFQAKYTAYNMLKSSSKIVLTVARENDSVPGAFETAVKQEITDSNEVDYAYMEPDGNPNRIKALINKKNMLYSKITSALDLRSHLKMALNDEQIERFTDFMKCYYAEDKIIKENIERIKPGAAEAAYLKNDPEQASEYSATNETHEYECSIINSILRIVESGNKVVQVL